MRAVVPALGVKTTWLRSYSFGVFDSLSCKEASTALVTAGSDAMVPNKLLLLLIVDVVVKKFEPKNRFTFIRLAKHENAPYAKILSILCVRVFFFPGIGSI